VVHGKVLERPAYVQMSSSRTTNPRLLLMKNIAMSQFAVFICAVQLTDNALDLSSAMKKMKKNTPMMMITGSL
jgi:hypothetical protein